MKARDVRPGMRIMCNAEATACEYEPHPVTVVRVLGPHRAGTAGPVVAFTFAAVDHGAVGGYAMTGPYRADDEIAVPA